MAEPTIRKATKEDYEAVIGLYDLFIQNLNYKKPGNDSYDAIIKESNAMLEVALVDGKIVGFISYSLRYVVRYPKPIIEVEEFFVLEEYQRMKIGKQLMNNALEFAKNNDCKHIFLASGKKRVEAHEFYKDYGFEEYSFHYRLEL